MKMKFVILVVWVALMGMTASSQEIIELNEIESGTEFWELINKVTPLLEADTSAAIKLLETTLFSTENIYTKSSILESLGALYVSTDQNEKCLDVCEELINSGLTIFYKFGRRTYPSFSTGIENNERYASLIEKNDALSEKMNEGSKAEYFIQIPNGYDKTKSYPLVMIFHGGTGNIQGSVHYWSSQKLQEEYIVAYVQGSHFLSSSRRWFGPTGTTDVADIYKQISADYPVDTSRTILAGPSAGGRLAVELAANNHVNAQGLILAFAVKPRELDASKIQTAGLNGLRVSLICGETDWALPGQKEMSVIFDKLSVANRIVIYPDLGHSYPDDFEAQIQKSVDFINKI